METVNLTVTGMTCGGCVRSIEKKLTSTPGVARAQVDLAKATATVDFDPARVQVKGLVSAIEQLGFQVPEKPAA
jgi:copper chaperone